MDLIKEAQKALDLSAKTIKKFSPFFDDIGEWRMKGRSARATFLSFDTRFPITLPENHQVTKLLMDHYNRYNQHGHHSGVLNEFRKQYVENNSRRELNRVIRDCAICVLQKTKPIAPPGSIYLDLWASWLAEDKRRDAFFSLV